MSRQKPTGLLQLEGKTQKGGEWTIPISISPFFIGRQEDCDLRLNGGGVSRRHAQIHARGGVWLVADCGSTNGTYLNGRPVQESRPINPGDILQFANFQFTVALHEEEKPQITRLLNPHARSFDQMMSKKAVTPYFQPIVSFSDQSTLAYEILGRVYYEGLPQNPGQLFEIAETLDREIELSQMFRDRGLEQAKRCGLKAQFFFNTVPREMDIEQLAASLERVREEFPTLRMAMELHESAVTSVPMIKRLREVLRALDIYLVYDDFGAGQARLLELIHATPDVVKFDMSLIRAIHTRPKSSQAIVAALVKMARDAGIKTVAEGVESQDEADVCRQMGFDMAQGFFFGQPGELHSRRPAAGA